MSVAGVPHVPLVGVQVPSCGPMALCVMLVRFCDSVALMRGAAGASGAVGDSVGAPVAAVSWWMGGAVGSDAGPACPGLVPGVPVVSLTGVACGVVLRCVDVPGLAACCVCVVPIACSPEGSGGIAVMVTHTATLTRMLKIPKVPLPLLSFGRIARPSAMVSRTVYAT
ncbi:hypothetical protein FHX77_000892 [Bifidobacterium commune]|nr:hypothetical protein [Bifidobacterium commune]